MTIPPFKYISSFRILGALSHPYPTSCFGNAAIASRSFPWALFTSLVSSTCRRHQDEFSCLYMRVPTESLDTTINYNDPMQPTDNEDAVYCFLNLKAPHYVTPTLKCQPIPFLAVRSEFKYSLALVLSQAENGRIAFTPAEGPGVLQGQGSAYLHSSQSDCHRGRNPHFTRKEWLGVRFLDSMSAD